MLKQLLADYERVMRELDPYRQTARKYVEQIYSDCYVFTDDYILHESNVVEIIYHLYRKDYPEIAPLVKSYFFSIDDLERGVVVETVI